MTSGGLSNTHIDSLKVNFYKLSAVNNLTGDPSIPPHMRCYKYIALNIHVKVQVGNVVDYSESYAEDSGFYSTVIKNTMYDELIGTPKNRRKPHNDHPRYEEVTGRVRYLLRRLGDF